MSKKTHKTSVGGQALIEGVMMQGPRGMATAVRKPDGEILTEYHTIKLLRNKNKFFNIPIIRGIVGFVESMVMGYKTLMYSAEVSGMEDFEEQDMSKFERWLNDKFGEKLVSFVATIGSILGVVLAFLLFFYLPVLVFNKANEWSGGAITDYQGLIEGIMKILIFVIYIAAVSRMKDIKRLFMYHGAEHKSIACYEAGLDLTVENAKKCTRFHPRCGTSFIFVVLIFSIIVYTIVAKIFPEIAAVRVLWLVLKLAFLPIIMGVCYEFIRYAGRHDNLFVKIVSAPGLWMQRLTTKEPTDDILEVGIAAIKAVITDNPEDDEIK
ncbi:MAG TPA: DUF1385 domain-containing protein [Candidatus Eubacterium faecipullorum]|uniref:DUF1385 domain-containing protein n=1 Tax=Candidatus Eubacterium faecipullorum TaxID=2838571 RepID=A0A9D1RGK0_9FIRM|nr:DUF1385 domain-containing protein [Candidatus Eubacterium faecipullorum]